MPSLVARVGLALVAAAALAGCSSEDSPDPSTSPSVLNADLDAVEHRWNGLSKEEQERVCAYADASDGEPDYDGARKELQKYDYSEQQAAEMLPTVVNKCT